MSISSFLSNDVFVVVLVLVCMAFSALFSSAETAIFVLGEYRMKQLLQVKGAKAKNLKLIMKHPNKMMNTITLGDSLADVTASMAVAFYAYAHYGVTGLIPALIIMVLVVYIFGETLPKSICHNNPASILLFDMVFIKPIFYLFLPFTWVLNRVLHGFMAMLGKEVRSSVLTEDDLAFIIDEQSVMNEQKQEMLANIFDISEIQVREVMTPRTDMSAVSIDISKQDLLYALKKNEYSRMPIYNDTLDNVIGILHIKDIFKLGDDWNVSELVRMAQTPLFIPESKKIDILLQEFQIARNQMAIVVDEYGGVAGLVTMEDILEEIVGEIRDEYDSDEGESEVVIISEGHFRVDAMMNIDDFCEYFFITKTEDMSEYDTVAGLVLDIANAIPEEGEHFQWNDFDVVINQMKSNKIEQVDFIQQATGANIDDFDRVNMEDSALYKQTYFHAVRRAMGENEAIMEKFMDTLVLDYSIEKLKKLDDILLKISDSELLDLITGAVQPSSLKEKYDIEILNDIASIA